MNVAVMKTKAEQALAEQSVKAAATLPGDAALRKTRESAAAAFAALGLPHRRVEEWKYTDLRALMKETAQPSRTDAKAVKAALAAALPGLDAATYVFVDGNLDTASMPPKIAGVTVASFAAELQHVPELLEPQALETLDAGAQSLIALNAALAADGAHVMIAAKVKPAKPIHLVFISSGAAFARNVILAGAGSDATVVETHISPDGATRQENIVTDITLARDATLRHAVVADVSAGSVSLAQSLVRLTKDARYEPFQLTRGAGLSRHQTTLTFAEEDAIFDFSGAALVHGAGHADTTLVVDHAVPHCTSRELYKTVLDGAARAVFQGKVIVRPDAQKTDGKQMAQALMLSPDAEFDSKPELEIYADDVVCGHGATSAQLDDDMLFYCKSRGIPEIEARALLIESFIGEAIDKIAHEATREAIRDFAYAWLRSAKS
ncbi:MAG: Fe-S cluster assembly protein SufD [Hyphomicrobium sp.]